MSFWGWKNTLKSPRRKTDEFDHIEGDYGGVIQAGINDNRVYVQNNLDKEGTDKIFEVVAPTDRQLAIDYDAPMLPPRFEEALSFLVQTFCQRGDRLTYRVTMSRHGNLHVMIDLPKEISELERLAWHGVFESDWKRTAAALMCMRRGVHNNTLLVERRDAEPVMTGSRSLETPETAARMFRPKIGE